MSFVVRIDNTIIVYRNNVVSMLPFTSKYNTVPIFTTGSKVKDHKFLSFLAIGKVSNNKLESIFN